LNCIASTTGWAPKDDPSLEQDLLDLILATNQPRRVMFGHPPIFVGVARAGRVLVSSAVSGACEKPNLVQRAGIAVLGAIARFTGRTVGLGASGSAGAGVILGGSVSISRQVVVSPSGQAAFETTYGINTIPVGVTMGAGAIGGVAFSISGAASPEQLAGFSADGSYGGGDGVGGGVDISTGSTWQTTATVGAGIGGRGGAANYQVSSIDPICTD